MKSKILRLPKVKKRTGLTRPTIYRWIADQKFPKQIELGGSVVGWLESDIEQWIDQCLANSNRED